MMKFVGMLLILRYLVLLGAKKPNPQAVDLRAVAARYFTSSMPELMYIAARIVKIRSIKSATD